MAMLLPNRCHGSMATLSSSHSRQVSESGVIVGYRAVISDAEVRLGVGLLSLGIRHEKTLLR